MTFKVAIYSSITRSRIAKADGICEDYALQLAHGWKMYHNIFIYIENYGKIQKTNAKTGVVLSTVCD